VLLAPADHWRADDHPGCEDRDEQPGLGNADLQVAGDLRQQARDDELGGEHEERADGQHVHDEREPHRGGGCRRPGRAGQLVGGHRRVAVSMTNR
jgi:hypothetical protein